MNRWRWKWDLGPLTEIQVAINDALDELSGLTERGDATLEPALESTAEGYRVTVAVPGMSREEISIGIEGSAVTIEGERQAPPTEGAQLIRRERRMGRFRKTVRLPEPFDQAGAKARLTDGLLTIELPRSQAQEPQRIEIDVEDT